MKQIELPNQRSNKKWTNYLATGVAEGFEEAKTKEEVIESWACLIKTGLCNTLQGSFGRQAQRLINSELIEKDGTINWTRLDEE